VTSSRRAASISRARFFALWPVASVNGLRLGVRKVLEEKEKNKRKQDILGGESFSLIMKETSDPLIFFPIASVFIFAAAVISSPVWR
jgi:hypothetical protein